MAKAPKIRTKKSVKSKRVVIGKQTKQIKSIVDQQIKLNAEPKSVQVYVADLIIYNPANALNFGLCQPMSPYGGLNGLAINWGTGPGQRVGNQIKLKSIIIRGLIDSTLYNVTTNVNPQPRYVKIWFLTDKLNPLITPLIDNTFMQLNNGHNGLVGTSIDMITKVNSDRWTIHTSRMFKIGNASNLYGSTVSNNAQSYSNNDFKYTEMFSIDLTRYCVKNLKYNDNSSDPSTRGMWMLCESVNANGTVSLIADANINLSYTLDCEYYDM